ncbi:unnamed protein product, partial [Brenthis ino]
MPRAAANPPHIIFDTLKELRFIDDKGNLLPWSNDVWRKATVAMNFLNMVARWSCFNRESPEKKDFFLRCVGLLTTCMEIYDFIRLCTDVLTIAFATHENIDDNQSHCFAAQNRVSQRLKSYNLSDNGADKINDNQNKKETLLEQFNDVDGETELDSSAAIGVILKKSSQIAGVNSKTDD